VRQSKKLATPAGVDVTLRFRYLDTIQRVLDHLSMTYNPLAIPFTRRFHFPVCAKFVIARQTVHDVGEISAAARADDRPVAGLPVFRRSYPAAQALTVERRSPAG